MPRPNQPRAVRAERDLAERIAHERKQRGMSYEGLAQRMTDAGCPINGSALYKIEHGTPRRRITVDELTALAEVFDLPIDELLLPPSLVLSREALRLVDHWRALGDESARIAREAMQAWQEILDYAARVDAGPGRDALVNRLAEVSDSRFEEIAHLVVTRADKIMYELASGKDLHRQFGERT